MNCLRSQDKTFTLRADDKYPMISRERGQEAIWWEAMETSTASWEFVPSKPAPTLPQNLSNKAAPDVNSTSPKITQASAPSPQEISESSQGKRRLGNIKKKMKKFAKSNGKFEVLAEL